jgi:hypothetical protein
VVSEGSGEEGADGEAAWESEVGEEEDKGSMWRRGDEDVEVTRRMDGQRREGARTLGTWLACKLY